MICFNFNLWFIHLGASEQGSMCMGFQPGSKVHNACVLRLAFVFVQRN